MLSKRWATHASQGKADALCGRDVAAMLVAVVTSVGMPYV